MIGSMRLRCTFVAAALLGSSVLGAPMARAHGSGDRFTYVKAQPNLCRNIDNIVHRHARPYRIVVPAVHGTYDFTDGRDGYSLRTCDWKTRSGVVYYRCDRPRDGAAWKIAVTGSGESGSTTKNRTTSAMKCDGRLYKFAYRWPRDLNTHVHLWGSESSTLRNVTVYVPS